MSAILNAMDVYGVNIPYEPLTNFQLYDYAEKLGLKLRGVYMRDGLPSEPQEYEQGIVNFNKLSEKGTHWICYLKKGASKWYFDSMGGPVLQEVRDYLKSPIYRNTDIVQPADTPICGHLCLYILKSFDKGLTFRETLNNLTYLGGEIKWTSPLSKELHRSVRKNFPKRYVFTRDQGIFGADLVDMKALSRKNKGFKYILMVEDIFSKYGWAVPIKFKTGAAVTEALKKIFAEKIPKKIWADKGTEFYNKEVDALLKKHDIQLYSTENHEKCSVIERWNRTIKTWIYKYFTANGTNNYVDVLDALIKRYNNTKHRSIGMTPVEAQKPENREKVFKNLYGKKVMIQQKPKFKVGTKVRLAVEKDLFEKAYIINWSDKIYSIKQVLDTRPVTYIVEDDRGVEHKGKFYEQELQKTTTDTYRVEKVLRYKTEKGKRYALVKWMDYDSSYNSWISAENIGKDLL